MLVSSGLFPCQLPHLLPSRRTRTASACERASDTPEVKGKVTHFCRQKGHGFILPMTGDGQVGWRKWKTVKNYGGCAPFPIITFRCSSLSFSLSPYLGEQDFRSRFGHRLRHSPSGAFHFSENGYSIVDCFCWVFWCAAPDNCAISRPGNGSF